MGQVRAVTPPNVLLTEKNVAERPKTSTMSKINRFFSSSNNSSINCNNNNNSGNNNEIMKNSGGESRSFSGNSMTKKSVYSGGSSSNNDGDHEKEGWKDKEKEKKLHNGDISRGSSIRTKNSSINNNNNNNNTYARFKILPDGKHTHNLSTVKRQEKLGKMVKDWISGANHNRHSDAVSAIPNIFANDLNDGNNNNNKSKLPPSLFSTYLREQHIGGEGGDSSSLLSTQPKFKDNERNESFIEKYGKCNEIIGKGTFGIVRIAHKKVNNTDVMYAVKEFTKRDNEPEIKYSKRLTYEFCISSSLKHCNIINAFDLFKDLKGEYCEVMEYCSGGDLYSLIVSAGKLEYIEADCFFKQIMRAVHYMHNMGVAHRDLKPENILLTNDGTIKITDFGSAECFKTAWDNEIELSNKIKGSSAYIAPEQFINNEFDPRFVDVWSCGVIYMAMRTGRQLWKEARKEDEFFLQYLRRRKCEKGYEPIEQLKRARCRNVIYSILDPVPERRITTLQVLNSEWVREIYCCKSV